MRIKSSIVLVIEIVVLVATLWLCCMIAGCGVWVEIEHDPETGKMTVLYENRRPFAPENATVKAPGGWEIHMGEQSTQNAVAAKLTDALVVLSGAATP